MEEDTFYYYSSTPTTTFSPICKNQDLYYYKHIESLIDKTTNHDEKEFKLLNYPSNLVQEKRTKVKYWKELQYKAFQRCLNELYEKQPNELITPSMTKNNKISYFRFNDTLSKFHFRAVEVNCRILSHYDGSQDNSSGKNSGGNETNSTNLTRIGNIKFKGPLQNLIEELLRKCISIMKRHVQKVTESLNDAICYINSRCYSHPPSLNWCCRKIKSAAIQNPNVKELYSKHQQQMKNNGNIIGSTEHFCFFQRQMFGHAFLPFIDLNGSISKDNNKNIDADDDENGNDDNNNNKIEMDEEGRLIEVDPNYYYQQPTVKDELLFDNLFISCIGNMKEDVKRSVWGLYKKDVNYEKDNFLAVGNCVCSALMDFTLEKIGLSATGINLYIKPMLTAPIYFTNVKSEIEIPSAGEYLTSLCLENKHYQDKLVENGLASTSSFANAFPVLSFINKPPPSTSYNKATEGGRHIHHDNNNNNNNKNNHNNIMSQRKRFDNNNNNNNKSAADGDDNNNHYNNTMKRKRFDDDEEYDDDDEEDYDNEERGQREDYYYYKKKKKNNNKYDNDDGGGDNNNNNNDNEEEEDDEEEEEEEEEDERVRRRRRLILKSKKMNKKSSKNEKRQDTFGKKTHKKHYNDDDDANGINIVVANDDAAADAIAVAVADDEEDNDEDDYYNDDNAYIKRIDTINKGGKKQKMMKKKDNNP